MENHISDIQHFSKLIKDTKFAMFTTCDLSNGSLYSRPMTLQQAEFDGDLWFFAGLSSDLVKQIEHNSKVNLAFSNIKDYSFLSAVGNAHVVRGNQAKQIELWSPVYKTWFPDGAEDPNLCLLRVNIEGAEYWESPGSNIVRVFGFVKGMITKDPKPLGQHGHLNLIHH